jgi:hypothetical protein
MHPRHTEPGRDGSGAGKPGSPTEADDTLPALGVMPLDQFCVNPPAQLHARASDKAIHYTLPDNLLGPNQAVDMFVVDLQESIEFLGHDLTRFHASELPNFNPILMYLAKCFRWAQTLSSLSHAHPSAMSMTMPTEEGHIGRVDRRPCKQGQSQPHPMRPLRNLHGIGFSLVFLPAHVTQVLQPLPISSG